MRRRFFRRIPLLALTAVLAALLYFGPMLRNGLFELSVSLQHLFVSFRDAIAKSIDAHFHQVETIERLRRERRRHLELVLNCRADAMRYAAMRSALEGLNDHNVSVRAARPYGYVEPGNFQRLWLEPFEGFDARQNYGVVRGGYAAGMVVGQEGRPQLLLAGDGECGFAVYVGAVRAPGIAMGEDARHMTVRYIPEWMRIAVGDEVVTSGLDHLFPVGVPVGKVEAIQKGEGFKNARITLYADTLHPDFVWVVLPVDTPPNHSLRAGLVK